MDQQLPSFCSGEDTEPRQPPNPHKMSSSLLVNQSPQQSKLSLQDHQRALALPPQALSILKKRLEGFLQKKLLSHDSLSVISNFLVERITQSFPELQSLQESDIQNYVQKYYQTSTIPPQQELTQIQQQLSPEQLNAFNSFIFQQLRQNFYQTISNFFADHCYQKALNYLQKHKPQVAIPLQIQTYLKSYLFKKLSLRLTFKNNKIPGQPFIQYLQRILKQQIFLLLQDSTDSDTIDLVFQSMSKLVLLTRPNMPKQSFIQHLRSQIAHLISSQQFSQDPQIKEALSAKFEEFSQQLNSIPQGVSIYFQSPDQTPQQLVRGLKDTPHILSPIVSEQDQTEHLQKTPQVNKSPLLEERLKVELELKEEQLQKSCQVIQDLKTKLDRAVSSKLSIGQILEENQKLKQLMIEYREDEQRKVKELENEMNLTVEELQRENLELKRENQQLRVLDAQRLMMSQKVVEKSSVVQYQQVVRPKKRAYEVQETGWNSGLVIVGLLLGFIFVFIFNHNAK